MTTSLWINNSLSNAKVSWTTLTVPSIAFSIAQNPKSISPVEVLWRTSEWLRYKTCSAEAKSLCVNKADSVKVPDGPRYPTLKLVTSPTPEG